MSLGGKHSMAKSCLKIVNFNNCLCRQLDLTSPGPSKRGKKELKDKREFMSSDDGLVLHDSI